VYYDTGTEVVISLRPSIIVDLTWLGTFLSTINTEKIVVQLLSLLTLHKRYNIICPTVAETAGEQPARIQLKINEKKTTRN